MSWHVDPGLQTLMRQWHTLHPGATIGTIGNSAHAKTKSDHNPEADGSVDALDFMPDHGVTQEDLDDLKRRLVASRDKRIAYIIRRQTIVSATIRPWQDRPYNGHYHSHLHLSVNDLHSEDARPWDLTGIPGPPQRPKYTMPPWMLGPHDAFHPYTHSLPPVYATVRAVQRKFYSLGHNIIADGRYGSNTLKLVEAFQRAHNLAYDGLIGPKTYNALRAL